MKVKNVDCNTKWAQNQMVSIIVLQSDCLIKQSITALQTWDWWDERCNIGQGAKPKAGRRAPLNTLCKTLVKENWTWTKTLGIPTLGILYLRNVVHQNDFYFTRFPDVSHPGVFRCLWGLLEGWLPPACVRGWMQRSLGDLLTEVHSEILLQRDIVSTTTTKSQRIKNQNPRENRQCQNSQQEIRRIQNTNRGLHWGADRRQ